MNGPRPRTLEEKRRALLRLRLRHRQEEVLAQRGTSPAAPAPDSDQQGASPLVPLKSTGTRPPLFLVHAVGGSVAPYVALAALLGDDQPVYALEDPALGGGPAEARSLPDIAAAYLAAVREVCPRGPLRLGGWSAGGAVALDMARQDGDVEVVLVLDTGIPDAPSTPRDDELHAWFDADVAEMGAGLDEAELTERYQVFAGNVRAFLRYQPPRVDARVVLLHTDEHSEPGYVERWRALADVVRVVPGDHYTMLRNPHIEALAEAMRDELSEVDAR
ncbi:thioesterase domain-containing protein [Lentzea californiensis]|uniref:thioesterase domain-containing protein n=1 Tax=Lentzea californiensis TaxID=438851 RepID=UPI00216562CC|nr:alpha/beta fold hydrolase [Lentzea californiensis]MCR3750114.1 Thioesterase domain-containing protein [Lentzea californiensis]